MAEPTLSERIRNHVAECDRNVFASITDLKDLALEAAKELERLTEKSDLQQQARELLPLLTRNIEFVRQFPPYSIVQMILMERCEEILRRLADAPTERITREREMEMLLAELKRWSKSVP